MKFEDINFAQRKSTDFNVLTRLYQYYALFILFLPIFSLFYKFRFEKNKKLDKNKLYIVAPNHISYLDVFAINHGFGRRLAYMAKKELFRLDTKLHKYVAKNIWRLGAFAVNREKVSLSTIKTVKEVFKANYNLCIFPQGGIRKNKTIEHINGGFIYFAKKNKIDIIPAGITGLETYNWNPLKRKDISIKIGEPISYELNEDEILQNWENQVCELTGYKKA